jgi:hypothetical protein
MMHCERHRSDYDLYERVVNGVSLEKHTTKKELCREFVVFLQFGKCTDISIAVGIS